MLSKIKLYTSAGHIISIAKNFDETIVKGMEADITEHGAEIEAAKALLTRNKEVLVKPKKGDGIA